MNVPRAELTTQPSVVVHAKSGRRIAYGEIVAFATIQPVAPEIKLEDLKKASDFRLIGHDVMRIELPTKINGGAKYAIDVQVPGMIYGAVARSPVEGGAPDRVDEAAAKAVAGVIDIVHLPYGVGVLAQNPWAAFNGKFTADRMPDPIRCPSTRSPRPRGRSHQAPGLASIAPAGRGR